MKNTCFILLLLISQMASAQQSIGINFGLPQYNWSDDLRPVNVTSESVGSYLVEMEYLRPLKNSLSIGIDAGVNKISNIIRHWDQTSSYSAEFDPLYNFGATPKLLYHLNFGESRFGAFLSLGPSFRWTSAKDRSFGPPNYRIIGQKVMDSGNPAPLNPIEQNPYRGTETVKNFSAVLRPELGFGFQVSDHSKFLVRFQYGIRMFSPLIARNFESVEIDGQATSFRNILTSDFSAVQIGYQLLIHP